MVVPPGAPQPACGATDATLLALCGEAARLASELADGGGLALACICAEPGASAALAAAVVSALPSCAKRQLLLVDSSWPHASKADAPSAGGASGWYDALDASPWHADLRKESHARSVRNKIMASVEDAAWPLAGVADAGAPTRASSGNAPDGARGGGGGAGESVGGERAAVLLIGFGQPAPCALRCIQLWHTTTCVRALALASTALPDKAHAAKKVLYAPGGQTGPALAAAEVHSGHTKAEGEARRRVAWECGLRHLVGEGVCAPAQGRSEGADAASERAEGSSRGFGSDRGVISAHRMEPSSAPLACALPTGARLFPVALSVVEQLEAASDSLYEAAGTEQVRLLARDGGPEGGGGAALVCDLVRSEATRFSSGGYADAHYVREDPNAHGAYFELADACSGMRFCYAALSVFDPSKSVRCRPYAPPGRQLIVAQVDRLAVLPTMRRRGAAKVRVDRVCVRACVLATRCVGRRRDSVHLSRRGCDRAAPRARSLTRGPTRCACRSRANSPLARLVTRYA